MPAPMRTLVLAALACACACSAPPPDAALPDLRIDAAAPDAAVAATIDAAFGVRAGLVRLQQVEAPGEHVSQILIQDDIVYVASTAAGLDVYRLGAGKLSPLFSGQSMKSPARCSTIALHGPSATLFCAAPDDAAGVRAYDVHQPDQPILLPPIVPPLASLPGYSRLYVAGDALFAAALEQGLLRAPIAANGALGPFTRVGPPGAIVVVDGDGGRLVAIARDGTLIVLGLDGTETGRLALDGPPLGLTVRGGRAAVALGSQGAAIVDLAGAPAQTERVHPPCVATAADVSSDRWAVACTSGTLLYQLGAAPRLAGFYPADNTIMDVRIAGDLLLATDWRGLDVLAADPTGHVVEAEVPPGLLLHPGVDAVVPLRNLGDLTLHLQFTINGAALSPLTLAAGAQASITVPAALLPPRPNLVMSQLEIAAAEDANPPVGTTGQVTFALIDSPLTAHHVTVGDPFPTLTPSSPLPAGTATTVAFIEFDCQMQWIEVVDLAWLATHGQMPGGQTPLVLLYAPVGKPVPWEGAPFMSMLGAAALDAHRFEDYRVTGFETSDPVTLFSAVFSLNGLVPGADVSVDYVVDEHATIRSVERLYRGRFPFWATH